MTNSEQKIIDFGIDAITLARTLEKMENPHRLLMLMGAEWNDVAGDDYEEYVIGSISFKHLTGDYWSVEYKDGEE